MKNGEVEDIGILWDIDIGNQCKIDEDIGMLIGFDWDIN